MSKSEYDTPPRTEIDTTIDPYNPNFTDGGMVDLIWDGRVIGTVCALVAAAIFLATQGCDAKKEFEVSSGFALPTIQD